MTDSSPLENRGDNRSRRPHSQAFRDFISTGWEHTPYTDGEPLPAAAYTPARREALSAAFPGERLIIPAGSLKVRSNDVDYRFRAHSAFIHLSGLESDHEPEAILVFEPTESGHEQFLYFRPRAGADTEEFFADSRYGEYWVGPRADLDTMEKHTGITTRDIRLADDAITKDLGSVSVRLVRNADTHIDMLVEMARTQESVDIDIARAGDDELAQFLSELRLIKDDYEITQLREAIAMTRRGFDSVVESLPQALEHSRGERVVEAAFAQQARTEGNGVGYDTIAASGNHACTLHWIRNTGAIRPGDVLLLDAGVEADSLYTADITRCLPVSGTFSEVQAMIYDAVLAAADAAFEMAARHPHEEIRFRTIHDAAIRVIAEHLDSWGLLPVSLDEALAQTGQQHRRWMVHGTSHHLGLDVHDCAQARSEMYLDAVIQPGMVFTIEPGLYFKENDQLVPPEFRGIGIRIEDDVLVTDNGVENLSAAFPRTRSEVEAWVQRGAGKIP